MKSCSKSSPIPSWKPKKARNKCLKHASMNLKRSDAPQLGGAEYLRQGFSKEYVNLLMGHTSQRMTDDYIGQHINWTECRADLVLETTVFQK